MKSTSRVWMLSAPKDEERDMWIEKCSAYITAENPADAAPVDLDTSVQVY